MEQNHHSIRRRLCLLLFLLAAAIPPNAHAAGKLVWKAADVAQVRVAGHSQKIWNVYQVEKNNNVVLVQVWKRYLLIDLKQRTVYELQPSDLEPHGKDFVTGAPGEQGRIIPTSEWVDRDIGPAELIRMKLMDYRQILEVQVPHIMDLRRGIY